MLYFFLTSSSSYYLLLHGSGTSMKFRNRQENLQEDVRLINAMSQHVIHHVIEIITFHEHIYSALCSQNTVHPFSEVAEQVMYPRRALASDPFYEMFGFQIFKRLRHLNTTAPSALKVNPLASACLNVLTTPKRCDIKIAKLNELGIILECPLLWAIVFWHKGAEGSRRSVFVLRALQTFHFVNFYENSLVMERIECFVLWENATLSQRVPRLFSRFVTPSSVCIPTVVWILRTIPSRSRISECAHHGKCGLQTLNTFEQRPRASMQPAPSI